MNVLLFKRGKINLVLYMRNLIFVICYPYFVNLNDFEFYQYNFQIIFIRGFFLLEDFFIRRFLLFLLEDFFIRGFLLLLLED